MQYMAIQHSIMNLNTVLLCSELGLGAHLLAITSRGQLSSSRAGCLERAFACETRPAVFVAREL